MSLSHPSLPVHRRHGFVIPDVGLQCRYHTPPYLYIEGTGSSSLMLDFSVAITPPYLYIEGTGSSSLMLDFSVAITPPYLYIEGTGSSSLMLDFSVAITSTPPYLYIEGTGSSSLMLDFSVAITSTLPVHRRHGFVIPDVGLQCRYHVNLTCT